MLAGSRSISVEKGLKMRCAQILLEIRPKKSKSKSNFVWYLFQGVLAEYTKTTQSADYFKSRILLMGYSLFDRLARGSVVFNGTDKTDVEQNTQLNTVGLFLAGFREKNLLYLV